jgi:UDP-glucuronate 4-epimerase
LKKQVLITGAAGFIGSHLALRLKKRGDFVIGLDNFNAYYDPQLKKDRAQLLLADDIELITGDILNQSLIETLLQNHQITHVVHLAAQAGVRHSITCPQEYASSNLQGFLSILEACRRFPSLKLIFASSSSVYGLNTKIPFSILDPTDRPANFYGATKKANELMAHAYHHLFGLSVTALRYFTAYGPWGRPDMAYYRFAEQISSNQPIAIYNHGHMYRDFTYIDDIVEGTVAAIDLGAPYGLFNLGHHRPVELLYLIELLEQNLGKKAIRNLLPMQPGEVLSTYADITESQEQLHFTPKVSIEEGMARFVSWYKEYNSCKAALHES